jgi:hypothetical protein
MPKLLSDADYHRVISYKKDLHMTNVAIAEELSIRRQTVATILRREAQTGDPKAQIKGNKRKTKSARSLRTPAEIKRLQDASVASPFKTPRVLKAELKLRCSLATIKRRLREAHLGGRRSAIKAFLTPEAKEVRLAFARRHKKTNWRRVMFTDEVNIITSAHGMDWVRRPPNTRYDPKYIREVNRQGRCKLNVWGAITSTQMLDLVVIEGTLNMNNYLSEILIPNVLPYKQHHDNMIFQQDGAGPHRANIVRDWLAENNIEKLQWPASSPDLNPIENLWNMLKEEIGPLNHIGPNQKEELVKVVKDAWERLRRKPRILTKLYGSMKRRIQQTIANKGAQTKY